MPDLLEVQVRELAVQYLCCYDRKFQASSRIALFTMLENSWLHESPLVMWLEVWKRIPESARPRFIEHTYLIDVVFAGKCSLSCVQRDIEQSTRPDPSVWRSNSPQADLFGILPRAVAPRWRNSLGKPILTRTLLDQITSQLQDI